MQANVTENLLRYLKVLFSNDVNMEIRADSLFDNFKDNFVVFFIFPGLNNGGRLGLQAIYNIPNLLFFKHSLSEISSLGPVFEASKLLSFLRSLLLVVILSKKEEE